MGSIRGNTFTNWGGTVRCTPAHVHYPTSTEGVAAIVRAARAAGETVRVVGTGHSWTPLVNTDGHLVSLDNLQGLIEVDKTARQATVWAGTKLNTLGPLLRENGLAMENLGDIDKQAIAGVLGTGTHGTGAQFGVLANQVIGLELVDGTGQIHWLTAENGDLFKAAQVSLGALGIITKIQLQLLPAYNLRCVKKREALETALANQAAYRAENRNYELYWFPYADKVLNIFLNETEKPAGKRGPWNYLVDIVWENGMFKLLSETVRLLPSLSRGASRFAANGMAEADHVFASHEVYANARLVRFYEMEYGVAAEDGPAVLRRIREYVRKNNIRVHFPIEYRYVKADDILLSPAQGQEMCFVSLHMYKGMPWEPYFRPIERIFQEEFSGRPHWGKMHSAGPEYLATVYPFWGRFLAARAELDPDGVFLNTYLRELLGVHKPQWAATAA